MSNTSSPHGHMRNVSGDSRRVAMPRRSTKGPLDIDIDEAPMPPAPTERLRAPPTPALQTDLPPSPALGLRGRELDPSTLLSPDSITSYDTPSTPYNRRGDSSPSPNTARPLLDLSPLLRPTLYNPVPTAGIPPPFLHSKHQPAPDAPLQTLLESGHFRHAAEKAADTLASSEISPFDIPNILSLYHIRLACLVLVSQSEISAKEARALLDILAREGASFSRPNSRATSRERSGERFNPLALIPWDLRLLLERLKTVLSNDRRRGIMSLYQLGSECRTQAFLAAKTEDAEIKKTWSARLYDIGLRVACELLEMGEFETASRHLQTLEKALDDLDEEEKFKMIIRKSLLYLKIGHVEAARACYAGVLDESREATMLQALHQMAEADYSSAVETLQSLNSAHPEDVLVTHNLAVCLLYNGDATRASEMLEDLVKGNSESDEPGRSFPGLLFNLATVYELRTERARDKKVHLVEQVADTRPHDGAVYERLGVDFKL